MPVPPKRMRRQTGPDVRGYLRRKLASIRDRLIERDGRVDEVYARAYGLDRIDTDEPIPVAGYEVNTLVPGVDPAGRYRIDRHNRITEDR